MQFIYNYQLAFFFFLNLFCQFVASKTILTAGQDVMVSVRKYIFFSWERQITLLKPGLTAVTRWCLVQIQTCI